MQENEKIRTNASYSLLAFGFSTVAILFAYPVFVNGIGSVQFGIFLLGTSAAGALGFLDFGFSSATLKLVAEESGRGHFERSPDYLKTSVVFYGAIGCLTLILLWIASPVLPKMLSVPDNLCSEAELVFRIVAIQIAVSLLINVYVSVLKSLQRFDVTSFLTILNVIFSYILGSVGVYYGIIGLRELALLFLISTVFMLILTILATANIATKVGLHLNQGKASWTNLRQMWKYSATFSVHSFAAVFFAQWQNLILGVFIGPAGVATYQVAYTALSKVHAIVNAALESLFPIASAVKDMRYIYKIYLRVMKIAFFTGALLIAPVTFWPEYILGIWLGTKTALEAAPLVPTLAIAFFIVSLSVPPFHILNGIGRPAFNVAYSAGNLFAYIIILKIFISDNSNLLDFATVYAISNLVSGGIYQFSVFNSLKRLATDYEKVSRR